MYAILRHHAATRLFIQKTVWVLIPVLLALVIGKESTGSLSSVEVFALCIILIPAYVLAALKSRWLVVYILAVWAFGSEVRRYLDWASGTYHPISPISLAPILCTMALLIPIIDRAPQLSSNMRTAGRWFAFAFIYASLIGVARNHFSAVWEMLNYGVPMLPLFYTLAVRPDKRSRDSWLASLSTIAVLVAIYGWIQYLTVPPWDAFWMVHSGLGSIGQALPLKVRIFSTLNSPGPTAIFFAFSLIPMLFERRWRGPFGWLGTLVVVSALAITMVRSAWLMVLVAVVVYIFRANKANRRRSLIWIALTTVGIYLLLPHLPGAQTIIQRGQTFSNLGQDQSANARLQFTLSFIPHLIHNPLGTGFGSTGVSTKLGNGGNLGTYGNFDNGLVDIFYTFGLFFGLVFFQAQWWLFRESPQLGEAVMVSKGYRDLAVTMLLAMDFALLSSNNFPGLGGLLLWFVVSLGLNPETDAPLIQGSNTQ